MVKVGIGKFVKLLWRFPFESSCLCALEWFDISFSLPGAKVCFPLVQLEVHILFNISSYWPSGTFAPHLGVATVARNQPTVAWLRWHCVQVMSQQDIQPTIASWAAVAVGRKWWPGVISMRMHEAYIDI